eukprot:GHVT01033042.1.p1 GENE.GHVT01033042.1~~GHVT01033042.1.p1  ORF type:complete len:199 (+),score=19.36 GHVT01033042.1:886-1482(+)
MPFGRLKTGTCPGSFSATAGRLRGAPSADRARQESSQPHSATPRVSVRLPSREKAGERLLQGEATRSWEKISPQKAGLRSAVSLLLDSVIASHTRALASESTEDFEAHSPDIRTEYSVDSNGDSPAKHWDVAESPQPLTLLSNRRDCSSQSFAELRQCPSAPLPFALCLTEAKSALWRARHTSTNRARQGIPLHTVQS